MTASEFLNFLEIENFFFDKHHRYCTCFSLTQYTSLVHTIVLLNNELKKILIALQYKTRTFRTERSTKKNYRCCYVFKWSEDWGLLCVHTPEETDSNKYIHIIMLIYIKTLLLIYILTTREIYGYLLQLLLVVWILWIWLIGTHAWQLQS